MTFDADGQHRVEDIEKVVEPIKNNNADLVIGSRFLDEKSHIPNYRKIGIKVITQVTNASIKKKLTDSQSGLELIISGFYHKYLHQIWVWVYQLRF